MEEGRKEGREGGRKRRVYSEEKIGNYFKRKLISDFVLD